MINWLLYSSNVVLSWGLCFFKWDNLLVFVYFNRGDWLGVVFFKYDDWLGVISHPLNMVD